MLAFGLFIRGVHSSKQGWFLASGLIGGLSVWLRHSGIATPIGVTLAIAVALMLRLLPPKPALRGVLTYWVGAAPPIAALWLRNVLVFGAIQPYSQELPILDVSVGSLLVGFREHLWELLLDLTGLEGVAMLAWEGMALILVLAPLGVVVTWQLFRRWQARDNVWRISVLVLAACSFVSVTTIVYANVRFGTYHEYRYPMQYSWCVVALALASFRGYPDLPDTTLKRLVLVLGTVSLVTTHGMFLYGQVERETLIREQWNREGLLKGTQWVARQGWRRVGNLVVLQLRLRLSRDKDLLDTVRELPSDALVVANDRYGGFLHFETGRPVRNLRTFKNSKEWETRLREIGSFVDGKQPLYCFLIPNYHSLLHTDSDVWERAALSSLPGHFDVVAESSNFILARYRGER
jgi:hypothetical protein